MISAWRIAKVRHQRAAFTGDGARWYGGRWNSVGVAMVYCAESRALAALELLANLDSSGILDQFITFEVRIAEPLIGLVSRAELPADWQADPPPPEVRAIGDAWIASARSVVLKVPSAVVPSEHNYLLNPEHPDFSRLRIEPPKPFHFDPRVMEMKTSRGKRR